MATHWVCKIHLQFRSEEHTSELQSHLNLKKKVEALMRKLEKLTKASPVFDENSKRGGQASEERSSAPTGPTEVNVEDSAGYRFDDTSLALETGIVGKR